MCSWGRLPILKVKPRAGRALGYLFMAACLCGGACSAPAKLSEAQGILLDVQSRDLVEAETVSLRTDNGSVRVFLVAAEVSRDPEHAMTASHLRQHMTSADPVVVRYREEGNGPLAVQIRDLASVR